MTRRIAHAKSSMLLLHKPVHIQRLVKANATHCLKSTKTSNSSSNMQSNFNGSNAFGTIKMF